MFNFFKKNKRKIASGFLMIEVIVGASIITITVLAFMSVATKSITVSRQALHLSQAGFLLEEGAEAVRIFRDNNWTNISGMTVGSTYYPTWNINTWILLLTSNKIDNFFTRTVILSDVCRVTSSQDISTTQPPCTGILSSDLGTKLVTVTVSWPEGGVTVTKTLKFYILNIFS